MNNQPYKFECGDKVKDLVTLFVGVVVGRSQFLTGCNRYAVQSQKLDKNDSSPGKWENFDENALALIKGSKRVELEQKPAARKRGGPGPVVSKY